MATRYGGWGRGSTVSTAAAPATGSGGRDGKRAVSGLALSVALSFSVLLFVAASYPLWPRMYLSPVLDLVPGLAEFFLDTFSTPLAHRAVEATSGSVFFYMYSTATLAMFGVYSAALWHARRLQPHAKLLHWAVGSAALACLLLLFAPTIFTSDLYSYIIYGRIGVAYGANPFVTAPNHFPWDPVYALVYWKDTVAVYGPVWIYLSSVLMAAVPPVVSQQIAAFKIVAALFHLANGLLIWRILEQRAPRLRLSGTIAYLWNPLLLIEFGDNGHNDVVMLFFLLLGVLSIVRGNRLRPLFFLTMAIFTKWIAAILLPIYVVGVLRERPSWRERAAYLLTAGAITLASGAALYLPYWEGPATVTATFRSAPVELFINSFAELMVNPFSVFLGGALPPWLGRDKVTGETGGYVLKTVAALLFLGYWTLELWRTRRASGISLPWLRVLFVYLVIACTWFWPWYISWLVPFAAIGGRGRLTQATLLFTFGGVLFYSLWPGAPLRPFEPYYDGRVVVLFGLPLLYLIVAAIADRYRSWLRVKSKA